MNGDAGPSAGKNIVICLDGTSNLFKEDNTNVVRLFRCLVRDPARQVAYYDPGVGTMASPWLTTRLGRWIDLRLGEALGRGLQAKAESAYRFLMRSYEPEDRVFVFGFSRGAYTARVLAGLLKECGLLEPGWDNLVPYSMRFYKDSEKRRAKAARDDDPALRLSERYRNSFARPVSAAREARAAYQLRIHFLGLWDTVKRYGLLHNPIDMPHESENPSVMTLRHAIAVDERRSPFLAEHWTPSRSAGRSAREVWFPGVHADVGGGYPESEAQLAKVSLDWMLREAEEAGLLLRRSRVERLVLGQDEGDARGGRREDYVAPAAGARAVQHESLGGSWNLMELGAPLFLHADRGEVRGRWQGPWKNRPIPPGVLHRSVIERMAAGPVPRRLSERRLEELRYGQGHDGLPSLASPEADAERLLGRGAPLVTELADGRPVVLVPLLEPPDTSGLRADLVRTIDGLRALDLAAGSDAAAGAGSEDAAEGLGARLAALGEDADALRSDPKKAPTRAQAERIDRLLRDPGLPEGQQDALRELLPQEAFTERWTRLRSVEGRPDTTYVAMGLLDGEMATTLASAETPDEVWRALLLRAIERLESDEAALAPSHAETLARRRLDLEAGSKLSDRLFRDVLAFGGYAEPQRSALEARVPALLLLLAREDWLSRTHP